LHPQGRPLRVRKVHVPPAQAEQLTTPQPRARQRQEHDAALLQPGTLVLLGVVDQVVERLLDRSHLDRGQDPPLAPWLLRPVNLTDSIDPDEPTPHGASQDQREHVQGPVERARAQSAPAFAGDELLDPLRVDLVEPELTQGRDQVRVEDSPVPVRRRTLEPLRRRVLGQPPPGERLEHDRLRTPVRVSLNINNTAAQFPLRLLPRPLGPPAQVSITCLPSASTNLPRQTRMPLAGSKLASFSSSFTRNASRSPSFSTTRTERGLGKHHASHDRPPRGGRYQSL